MSFIPSPTQSNVFVALRSFLLAIMPAGVEVIQAQDNLVPEPIGDDFVLMTPIMFQRLATNVNTYQDVKFTGSIAGTLMTVSNVSFGSIQIGQTVFGVGVATNTQITSVGTIPNTYNISVSQTIASQTLASGGIYFMQPSQWTVQLDVHGPNSSENAQTISTIYRDAYGVDLFRQSGFDVTPITADDPKQLPFTNEGQQVENRWVISAVMQNNQIIRAPQQFTDGVTVNTVNVEQVYPA